MLFISNMIKVNITHEETTKKKLQTVKTKSITTDTEDGTNRITMAQLNLLHTGSIPKKVKKKAKYNTSLTVELVKTVFDVSSVYERNGRYFIDIKWIGSDALWYRFYWMIVRQFKNSGQYETCNIEDYTRFSFDDEHIARQVKNFLESKREVNWLLSQVDSRCKGFNFT